MGIEIAWVQSCGWNCLTGWLRLRLRVEPLLSLRLVPFGQCEYVAHHGHAVNPKPVRFRVARAGRLDAAAVDLVVPVVGRRPLLRRQRERVLVTKGTLPNVVAPKEPLLLAVHHDGDVPNVDAQLVRQAFVLDRRLVYGHHAIARIQHPLHNRLAHRARADRGVGHGTCRRRARVSEGCRPAHRVARVQSF